MKHTTALLLILFLCFKGISQCAIKPEYSDDRSYISYTTEVESLYVNEDLENGYSEVAFHFTVQKSSSDFKAFRYYLQVISVFGSGKRLPIPRTIVFNNSKVVNANSKMKTTYYRTSTIESCLFELSLDDIMWYRNNDISSMKIEDPVEQMSISFPINGRKVNNQANCTLNIIKGGQ